MSDTIPNYIDYSAENYSEANRKNWAEHPYGTQPIRYRFWSTRTFSDYDAYLPHRRPGSYAAVAQPMLPDNGQTASTERSSLLTSSPPQSIEAIERSNLPAREKAAKIAQLLQTQAAAATQTANTAWQALWERIHHHAAVVETEDPALTAWKEQEKEAARLRIEARKAAHVAHEVARTAKWYRTAAQAEQVRIQLEDQVNTYHGDRLADDLKRIVDDKTRALQHITPKIYEHDNPYARYSFININWNDGNFIMDLDAMLDASSTLPPPATDATDTHVTVARSPRSYTFGLLGCHGVDGIIWGEDGLFSGYALPPTRRRALEEIGKELSNQQIYQFNFLLGDNFYHFGTTDPRSKQFATCFHRVFKNVPAFAILGNHDYNMHGQAKGPLSIFRLPHPRMRKIYRAMCQVYHSYIDHMDHDKILNKPPYGEYPHYTYPHSEFPHKWNMPFRYYCLLSHDINTVFICIDSNTLPFDKVQQQWLYKTYHGLKNCNDGRIRNMILVSHHPLEYYGERALKDNEWKKYVQDDLRNGLNNQSFPEEPQIYRYDSSNPDGTLITDACIAGDPLDKNKTMGHYLKYFLEQNNLAFNVIFAAHEHLMAYEKIHMHYRNHTTSHIIHQFVSGAGGADLEALNNRIRTTHKRTYNADTNEVRVYHKEAEGRNRLTYGYMQATLNRHELKVTACPLEGGRALNIFTIRFHPNSPENIHIEQATA